MSRAGLRGDESSWSRKGDAGRRSRLPRRSSCRGRIAGLSRPTRHGALVRGGRLPRRQRRSGPHLRPRIACVTIRPHAWDADAQGPRRLSRRLRLLRAGTVTTTLLRMRFCLSRAVGRPVRVQWMREDEHGWDPKGPPQLLALEGRARCRRANRRVAHRDVAAKATANLPNIPLLGLEAAGIAQTRRAFDGPHQPERRSAVRRGEPGSARALAQDDAVAAFEPPRAGQDRQLFRGREFHRRARAPRRVAIRSNSGWRAFATRAGSR